MPERWKQPTPAAELPADDSIAAIARFGDAQTGQLEKANAEKVDGFAIIARCEARDADWRKKLSR